MSKPDTWMPLYIGDYLADTMHLDAREHGAYLLLIMHYWRSGPLPDDDRMLAGIARVERKVWINDVAPVVRAFFSAESGKLHHKRVDEELGYAAEISAKRRDAANKRYTKAKDAKVKPGGEDPPEGQQTASKTPANVVQLQSKSDAIAHEMQPHARTCASALPSPSPREEDSHPSGCDAIGASPNARGDVFRTGLRQLRDLTGLPDRSARSVLGKLLREAGDDASAVCAALAEGTDLRPASPIEWLIGAVQTKTGLRENPVERRMRERDERLRSLALGDEDEAPVIDLLPERMLLQ